MAFLGKQYRKFDKNVVRGYDELNKKLHELIDEVRWSKNFPDDAKEFLCGHQLTDARGPFPFLKVREEYLLTKDGVKEVRKSKIGAEKPELEAKSIPVIDLITSKDDPEHFDELCSSLQMIIDKYKIKIPKEYLVL